MLDFLKSFLKRENAHDFDYTVNELVSIYEKSREKTKWHGEVLSDSFLDYKESDILFLLGSGPSINQINDREWGHIKSNDSIGFNFWFAHDFVPDIYVPQVPKDEEKAESMEKIFRAKLDQYKDVPFILRGSGFAEGLLEENPGYKELFQRLSLYYLNEYPISSKCSIEPNLLYRYMDALGFMTHGEIAKFIPKWRGTLGLLMMLGYQMGYKKIVLCGMDMDGSDHFWDYEPYLEVKEKYSLPGVGTSNIKTFTNKAESTNTVPKYVYTLRDWFKEKNDVEVYVMKEKTVLFPEVSLYHI